MDTQEKAHVFQSVSSGVKMFKKKKERVREWITGTWAAITEAVNVVSSDKENTFDIKVTARTTKKRITDQKKKEEWRWRTESTWSVSPGWQTRRRYWKTSTGGGLACCQEARVKVTTFNKDERGKNFMVNSSYFFILNALINLQFQTHFSTKSFLRFY